MAFGDVIKSFPSPSTYPHGLAFDGKNLWHVDATSLLVYCIDRATGTVIRSFSIATIDNVPRGLTFDGKYLWMSGDQNDRYYCIDPLTGDSVRSFPWTVVAYQRGLTFDGKHLISQGYSVGNAFYWIDRETGAVVGVEAGGWRTTDLAFDGKDIYIVRDDNNTLCKVSIGGQYIRIVATPSTGVEGLTFDGKNLWLADNVADRIYCISVN